MQPVSSLTWATILKNAMGASQQEYTVDEAIELYNRHPSVVAFESSSGAGAISLDPKKRVSALCQAFA